MPRAAMRRPVPASGTSHPRRGARGSAIRAALGGLLGAIVCVSVGLSPDRARPDQKPASVKVPPGVSFSSDLTYCSLRDCRPFLNFCPLPGGCVVECSCRVRDCNLKLNLARPTRGKGPFPAVVLIHGGGWLYGSHHDLV